MGWRKNIMKHCWLSCKLLVFLWKLLVILWKLLIIVCIYLVYCSGIQKFLFQILVKIFGLNVQKMGRKNAQEDQQFPQEDQQFPQERARTRKNFLEVWIIKFGSCRVPQEPTRTFLKRIFYFLVLLSPSHHPAQVAIAPRHLQARQVPSTQCLAPASWWCGQF